MYFFYRVDSILLNATIMLFKNNATIMRQHRLGTSLIKNALTILKLYCALFLRISHLGLDQTLK